MLEFARVSMEQRKSRVMGKTKGLYFVVFSAAVFFASLLTVSVCFTGCKEKEKKTEVSKEEKEKPSVVTDRTAKERSGKEGAGAEQSGGGENGDGKQRDGEKVAKPRDAVDKGTSAEDKAVARRDDKVKTEPVDVRAGKGGERKNRKLLYDLYLGENKIGTLIAEETFSKDEVTTIADARMKIVRAGLSIKIRAYEVFTEKLSGTPVSFRVLMDQGVSKMEAKGVYKDGKMVVTDSTGTNTLPYKNEWLFPYSVGELTKSKGFKAGTKYSYLKFQPQFGNKGVLFTHEIIGRETVIYKGKNVKCHKMKVSSPVLPSQTVCVDDNYIAYEMDMKMGGMSLKTKLVSISES